MKIKIKLHPASSQEKVVNISEEEYEIWIKTNPIDGKANEELIKILKKHFKKPVEILSGFSSRKKIVDIE